MCAIRIGIVAIESTMVLSNPGSLLTVYQDTGGLIKTGDAIHQKMIKAAAVLVKVLYAQIAHKVYGAVLTQMMTVHLIR
jgi:hypothetical protein